MARIQTTLGKKQSTEEHEDVIEHSSTVLTSTSSIEKNTDAIEHASVALGTISDKLLSIEQELCIKLQDVTFPSMIQYIYNPLEYASETHAMYVHKYCIGEKKVLFVGMNPGPWGMSQTGVPFGEISMVRNWLKIVGPVGSPSKEHPDRKVTGFQCTRSEISGLRLWGLFRDLCGSPENFFRYAYMHNYCPFAFMDARARNVTPAELKAIFLSHCIPSLLMLNYLYFSGRRTENFTRGVRPILDRHNTTLESGDYRWYWQLCRKEGTDCSPGRRSFSCTDNGSATSQSKSCG